MFVKACSAVFIVEQLLMEEAAGIQQLSAGAQSVGRVQDGPALIRTEWYSLQCMPPVGKRCGSSQANVLPHPTCSDCC